MAQKQNSALANLSGPIITISDQPLDFAEIWPGIDDVVIEIGFGTGTATVAMAMADRATGLLAIDVHTPGVGELLHRQRLRRGDGDGRRDERCEHAHHGERRQSPPVPVAVAGAADVAIAASAVFPSPN